MEGGEVEVEDSKPQKQFQSTIGVIFSCLGCVIGTGNIWRFPRIVAKNSGVEGAGCFLIIWCICLFLWSIPVLVIEYTIGRYTRVSPIRTFVQFCGKIGVTLGGWVTFVNFFIGSYYLVILGWCLYYIYVPMAYHLPSEEVNSTQMFNSFVKSNYAFIPFAISILLVATSVIGGIKVIERVNTILVPVLLLILLSLFFYASTLKYSEYGFAFLFNGDWSTLTQPSLYLDAISQNAFDTAAASGLITAYAMYLTKSNSVIRYSVFIPIINNAVSLLASMTIFPTVFGIMMFKDPTITQTGIVSIIQGGGLAGTGLTFTWIPILMETLGVFGSVLCSLFFLCLSFAGVSSIISNMELQTITLMEFGINRKISVILISASMFLFGSASVVELNFLVNQDYVWGFSLIVSGLIYITIIIRYGPRKFRNKIVNEQKFKRDFSLPFIWVIIITVVAPIEAVALLVWWIYSEISENPTMWYQPGWMTLITTWIEWILFAMILITLNFLFVKLRIKWIVESTKSLKSNSSSTENMKEAIFNNTTKMRAEDNCISFTDAGYDNENNMAYENPNYF